MIQFRVMAKSPIPSPLPGIKDFAPRFGFAWSPAPDGFLGKLLGGADKFSIRGGIGMFYNNLEGALEIDETGLAPFDIYYPAPLPAVFASPYTNRLDGGIHAPFPYSTQNFNWSLALPLGGYPVPPINQTVPYTETYNLTLQRQFGSNTVVTAGYLGNQSHHLLTQIANNPGNPQLCLSLSQPSEVAPGSPTCGPFLENAVFTRPNGTSSESVHAGPSGRQISATTTIRYYCKLGIQLIATQPASYHRAHDLCCGLHFQQVTR